MEPISATDFFTFIIILIIILLILICWNIYTFLSSSKKEQKDPNEGIKADIKKLSGEIAECKKFCEQGISKLSGEIDNLKKEIQKKTEDISAQIEEHRSGIEKESDKLNENTKKNTGDIQELNENIPIQLAELKTSLKKEISGLNEKIDKITTSKPVDKLHQNEEQKKPEKPVEIVNSNLKDVPEAGQQTVPPDNIKAQNNNQNKDIVKDKPSDEKESTPDNIQAKKEDNKKPDKPAEVVNKDLKVEQQTAHQNKSEEIINNKKQDEHKVSETLNEARPKDKTSPETSTLAEKKDEQKKTAQLDGIEELMAYLQAKVDNKPDDQKKDEFKKGS